MDRDEKKMNILIVDDKKEWTLAKTDILTNLGYEVVYFSDLEGALSYIIKELPVDMLIVDIGLLVEANNIDIINCIESLKKFQ
jgi:response regulator RpfG family c-di-GMP phosphodiesterase